MQICTVTGTLYNSDGSLAVGVRVYVRRAEKAGSIITTFVQPSYLSDVNAIVTLLLPRGSRVTLYAQATGLDEPEGVTLTVPDAPTATLEEMLDLAAYPVEGLIVKSNDVALAGRYADLNFSTSFSLTAAPSGQANVSLLPATGILLGGVKIGTGINVTLDGTISVPVIDKETAQDLLSDFFNPTNPSVHFTYNDPLNRIDITVDDATHTVAGLMSTVDKTALDAVPATYQPLNSQLTTFAGLTPANDDVLQRKAGTWASRTPLQLKADLALVKGDVGLGSVLNVAQEPAVLVGTSSQYWRGDKSWVTLDTSTVPENGNLYHTPPRVNTLIAAQVGVSVQAFNTNLTAIAGLSPSANDVIQFVGGAWATRTAAQLKSSLSLVQADISGLTTASSPTFAGLTVTGNVTSPGTGANSERFGAGADTSTSLRSTAIGNIAFTGGGNDNYAGGYDARVFGATSVVIGSGARGNNQVAIIGGGNTGSGANEAVIVGWNSQNGIYNPGNNSYSGGALAATMVGYNNRVGNTATSNAVTLMGASNTVNGDGISVLGDGNIINQNASIVLGSSPFATRTTAPNQFTAGWGPTYFVSEVYFGSGVVSTAPVAYSINGTGGSGSNVAGGAVAINGGKGTGTGTGGDVTISTAPTGSTGSSLNSLVTAFRVDKDQNVSIGSSIPSTKYRLTLGDDNKAGLLSLGGSTLPNGYLVKHKFSAGNQGVLLSFNARPSADASTTEYDDQTNFESGQLRYQTGANVSGGWMVFTAPKTSGIIARLQVANSGEVGVGNSAQVDEQLSIKGADTSSSRFAFTVRNSANAMILSARNDVGVGVGTSNLNAAALLQVDSTTKGFLPPRMTTTQKNAISAPPEALCVYDLTLHKLCVYTGSVWETVTSL